MVVMIAGIHTSQEIFAINVLTALKSSLEQRWKHVLRLLRLYGDRALESTYVPKRQKKMLCSDNIEGEYHFLFECRKIESQQEIHSLKPSNSGKSFKINAKKNMFKRKRQKTPENRDFLVLKIVQHMYWNHLKSMNTVYVKNL